MCINPINVRNPKTKQNVKVSCRQCINCRILEQSELEFYGKMAQQEAYSKGLGCSFVTLTYDGLHVPLVQHPVDEKHVYTLFYDHVRDFFKRLRSYAQYHNFPLGKDFKHITCGEYGDLGRPHYHSIFFGLHKELASDFVRHTWNQGIVDVGTLRNGGIRYVIDYITNSPKGLDKIKMFECYNQQAPFLKHSVKLGIDYLTKNYSRLADKNNPGCVKIQGKSIPLPRYIRNKFDLSNDFDVDKLRKELFNFHAIHFKDMDFDTFLYNRSVDIAHNRVIKFRQNHEPVTSVVFDSHYDNFDANEKLALDALESTL